MYNRYNCYKQLTVFQTLALERRRARDTSLPDWCEMQDSYRFMALETFGSKFPGGLLPADLRTAAAVAGIRLRAFAVAVLAPLPPFLLLRPRVFGCWVL